MNKETMLKTLDHMREIAYSLWEQYSKKDPYYWADTRDTYEMEVRVLDYLREGIRHDTV